MKFKKYLAILFISLSLSGCKKSSIVKSISEKVWIIEEYNIYNERSQKYESILFDLSINTLIFYNDFTCDFPNQSQYGKRGSWGIEKIGGNYFLSVDSPDKTFNGLYRVEFDREHKDIGVFVEQLHLTSNKAYIRCVKM
jgi:hypothetical protein